MSSNQDNIRKVICPNCKTQIVYSLSNPYRPFCSERCKLIDLGSWADEKYRIPLRPTPLDEENFDSESPKTQENDDESI